MYLESISMDRRVASIVCACAVSLFFGSRQVGAQTPAADYPSKPVKLVVPFPPGAVTDVAARLIAQKLSDVWKQGIVVDNKAGATGVLGSDAVAKSSPDGYTILMGTATTHAVLPALKPGLPYDNLKDFIPVGLAGGAAYVLAVHNSVPAKTVKELIALLKANPNKYAYASSGIGGFPHLIGEKFKYETGTEITHVPYKGNAPALSDLIGGQVQIGFVGVVDAKRNAKDFRPLAITSLKRSPDLPDVPSLAETLPHFDAVSWIGFFAPAGTPVSIVLKLQRDIHTTLATAEIKQKLDILGIAPMEGTSDGFAVFLRADTERWRQVGKAVHIVLE